MVIINKLLEVMENQPGHDLTREGIGASVIHRHRIHTLIGRALQTEMAIIICLSIRLGQSQISPSRRRINLQVNLD